MVIKIFLALALVVNLTCAADISGMLSQLYKKAASENRPLVLVLDNDQEDTRQQAHPFKLPAAADGDNERSVPSSLLELLNQKRQPPQAVQKPRFLDHLLSIHREHENEEKLTNLERLKRKLQREKQQRIEKRERLEQRNRDNQDQDRNQDRKQDMNQDRYQDQDRDYKEKEKREKRILRSSVITGLLRTYNDMNCEAKNDCEDDCKVNRPKNKKKCQKKCEVKYECEESVEEDPCDECDDDEEQPSTKGERLITYTEKCKRC